MLQSMTGFGSVTFDNEKISITADVKTLNSKFTDIFCRIPKTYADKEVEIRNLLTKKLGRGKIELSLNINQKGDSSSGTSVNRAVVKSYFRDLMETAQELGFDGSPTEILRMATMMPNTYNTDLRNEDEATAEWAIIFKTIESSIDKCIEFRKQEGLATSLKFEEYIAQIDHLLTQVAQQDPNRIPVIRERLEKAVADWVQNEHFNKDRFEQELIYYVEKYDISEEKVRLKNHLEYFVTELRKEESNGKKLNFISQEIGREINTIGSKANDAVIQRLVVQMKDELEKIKEQTLNIV